MDSDLIRISKLDRQDPLPFDLLLLADDEMQAIERYIYQSDIYVARHAGKQEVLGIVALLPINDRHLEIKAIAVEPLFHNKGIGTLLIRRAQDVATESGFEELHVGTADCAFKELAFYERRGFHRFAVKKDFFLKNYSKQLFESGVRLQDMVMLRMTCKSNIIN